MNPNQGPANEALVRPVDMFVVLPLQDVADSLQIGVAGSSEGKGFWLAISLCAVVDALEEQNDQCTSFLDPGTEAFLLRLEESRMIEEGYDEPSLPEWQFDLVNQTRDVSEKRRCSPVAELLRGSRVVDHGAFADVRWNHPIREKLQGAIHRSGLFRRFQDAIRRLGVEEFWVFEEQRWKKSRVNGWSEASVLPIGKGLA